MDIQKKQMQEAAILYYEKKCTQSEIADIMNLSRQTVSKLLGDAIRENIVEIKIHNPEISCAQLECAITDIFHIQNAVVCAASTKNESLCHLLAVKKAAEYIKFLAQKGNCKIAISWGRTMQMLIAEFEKIHTPDNIVFPLFGATDQVEAYFLSNELARSFADKLGAGVQYAWFPYRPDSKADAALFQKTSYYKKMQRLWNEIDIAIVGIGNRSILQTFGEIFGYSEKCTEAVGDIATHFFDADGQFLELYEDTLCVEKNSLKKAKQTIAVACGADKTEAIVGALRTGMLDTLITDEYTAQNIIKVAE